jgi:ATP-dependent RNA helicase RhlE
VLNRTGLALYPFVPIWKKLVNSFTELNLNELLLKAIAAEGYDKPTPIQARAIPPLMQGKDLLGIAQTARPKARAVL